MARLRWFLGPEEGWDDDGEPIRSPRTSSPISAERAQGLSEHAFHAFRAAGDTSGILLSWSLLVHAVVTGGDDLHPLDG